MTELLERNATSPVVKNGTPRPVKLLDQVRERICILHYSRSTEKTYLYWIKFFILHNNKRHPRDMGAAEVEAFLSHLATQREVSAGTDKADSGGMREAQMQLGHNSMAMTEHYVRSRRGEKVTPTK